MLGRRCKTWVFCKKGLPLEIFVSFDGVDTNPRRGGALGFRAPLWLKRPISTALSARLKGQIRLGLRLVRTARTVHSAPGEARAGIWSCK